MLQGRATPFIEEATERSRVSMRTRWERVRLAWRTMVQAAVAAAAAWWIARHVWGHPAPFFAPVAAILALGQTARQRRRRAVELVIGVSIGIAVADVALSQLGTGVVPLAIVVFLAMGVALFFGSSPLFINQAAVSAALVATILPPNGGITFARSVDALTGGVVALVVSAVLLPLDPLRLMREAARPVLDELAATLEDIAAVLLSRDREAADAALARARGIDELGARFTDAVGEGRETTRFAPVRRRSRTTVESYADAAAQVDLAVRNVRVLARGAIRAVTLDEHVPRDVAGALHDLARAVRALPPALEGDDAAFAEVRDAALGAATTATLVLERTGNLSVSVIVGQIRSTATDLLAGTGMSYDDAAGAVRAAAREAEAAAASSG